MKAAVLFEVNAPMQIVDVDLAPPRADEVRVKVKAAGICQSDWHIMNGDWPSKLPIILGHEAAGVVEEIGDGVCGVAVGDHVVFSFAGHCGHCRYCDSGRTALCTGHAAVPPGMLLDGTLRASMNGQGLHQMARIGCFAEQVVVPAEQVVVIRRDMPFAQAALVGCSVTTGVGAVVRHARVEPGASMLVIGCGGVGLNVVQGGRLSGAGKIIACDILDSKLEMARRFGATDVINSANENVVKRVRAIVGGAGVDYAFDTVAVDKTLSVAIDAIAPGGRTVSVGVPAMTMQASFSPFGLVFQEKMISGTFYGSSRPSIDFPLLVEHALARRLNIEDLISRTYRLEEINEGFAAMRAGGVARGVIAFD